jgi:hypothetical protein
MRRILRFLAHFQHPAPTREGLTGSTRAAHTSRLPLAAQDILTKSEMPRIVFPGIQPTGIPHVRFPLLTEDMLMSHSPTTSAR